MTETIAPNDKLSIVNSKEDNYKDFFPKEKRKSLINSLRIDDLKTPNETNLVFICL